MEAVCLTDFGTRASLRARYWAGDEVPVALAASSLAGASGGQQSALSLQLTQLCRLRPDQFEETAQAGDGPEASLSCEPFSSLSEQTVGLRQVGE